MNGKICVRCKKPMGNSLQTVRITEGDATATFDIHSKCMEGICLKCVSMIVTKSNGVCECGNEWKFMEGIMVKIYPYILKEKYKEGFDGK